MSDKLTKRQRQIRSVTKTMADKKERLELKELERQREAERAARDRRAPRRRDWSDDEEHEEVPPRRSKPIARGPSTEAPPEPPAESLGTVTEIRSSESLVAHRGRVVRAILPPGARGVDALARSPLAVGDRVQLEYTGVDAARIVAVSPRRSALTRDVSDPSRRGSAHKGQVLSANVDQVVVVCSPAEPPFRPRLIDRYLVAASRDSLPAVVCLNKVDLGVPDAVEACLRGYAGLGARVLRTSAATGEGLGDLRACVTGGVSLFTGHSGVGKSSLLNALEPGLSLTVGEVTQTAAGDGKGRHTTSSARLIPLSPPDTFVVDTPGIRAFGIRGMAPRDLAGHFPDIAALAAGCDFRDCLHRAEPGCAVRAAAHLDQFLRDRHRSYRAMLAELR